MSKLQHFVDVQKQVVILGCNMPYVSRLNMSFNFELCELAIKILDFLLILKGKSRVNRSRYRTGVRVYYEKFTKELEYRAIVITLQMNPFVVLFLSYFAFGFVSFKFCPQGYTR